MGHKLNPFLSVEVALTVREWYVRVDDGPIVGPVSANQIARGIKLGKVPGHAEVTHAGSPDWEGVLDNVAVVTGLKAL